MGPRAASSALPGRRSFTFRDGNRRALCGQQVSVIPLQREDRPVGSRRPSKAHRERHTLVHFGVFRFRCDQDGDIGVGVFPKREEIIVGGLRFGGVTLLRVGAGETEMRERPEREV
jgi:hypothetical protein